MLKPLKKRKRNTNLIIAITAGILMILSVVGFALNLKPQKEKNEGFWEFKVNIYGKEIIVKTIYLKNETNEVILNYAPDIQHFINKKIYFYTDPKIKENSQRLLYYISMVALIRETCVINYECFNKELPLKDCTNEIIIFEYSNQTEINKKEQCIIIKGNETTIEKSIDAFLYEMFKIK